MIAHRLLTTHGIMTSFNVKSTSEIYCSNLIIKVKEWKTNEIKVLTSSHHLVELKKIPGFQISTNSDFYTHIVTRYQLVNSIETAGVFSFYTLYIKSHSLLIYSEKTIIQQII